ncbi:MAG TPA: response regulator transcription factor [Cellvibrionaceae bacterium]|nr:response regulator transcription factor [Cellvibrionaceae bacterium]HMW71152.1 response regulator transcription factor [Cellvibrionaceae bacterium]HMY40916.1 response regulator transcription factor [Marinagarivorans sp.]HNG60275.1 response regulator transcription factor [Cellvibrionaceae bacterium]
MNKTILVAEDDTKIADIICKYLSLEDFSVRHVRTGLEALAAFNTTPPDLIILDVMLPELTGTEVCEHIRAQSNVPIIMISALAEDAHRLAGFAHGTDDYLCKPFNPRELIARIKAILRRAGPQAAEVHTISHGPICLHPEEQRVTVAGEPVLLTQIEFNMLLLLISSPTKVFSRESLLDKSHKHYAEYDARSVDFHIKNLRRKINIQPDVQYIKSVYGAGYKLI